MAGLPLFDWAPPDWPWPSGNWAWGHRCLGRGLVAFLGHQNRSTYGDHDDSGQREYVFLRHFEPHGWSLDRGTAGDHGFDQSIAGDLVDVARPSVGVFMNID